MKPFHLALAALVPASIAASACISQQRDLAAVLDGPDAASTSFVSGEASTDGGASDANSELASYCPSSKCPSGHTTCPASRFPCDVNLMSDRNNCGQCGVACPQSGARQIYECVEGRCEYTCSSNPMTLDCDGVPDNGCEANPVSNDHCGACDVKCTDPDKPCMMRSDLSFGCGCTGNEILCDGRCYAPESTDEHCRVCGNQCDPFDGPPLDPSINMYYGCAGSHCGQAKCMPNGHADCDGNLANGCEAALSTVENCGQCGNACTAGQSCILDTTTDEYRCMCDEGQTFCSKGCSVLGCSGYCVDIASDRSNCGGCGISCKMDGDTAIGTCVNGLCQKHCADGRADCNGNTGDGCEVNANSDPRNCGSCGTHCDIALGQACVGGRCVVERCPQTEDAGGGPQ